MADQVAAYLSRLPPSKWQAALERAGIVQEYLELERPSKHDAARFAERLGLQTRMFYGVVRAFKEARDGLPKLEPRADTGAVDPRAIQAIEEAIAELGPGAGESAVFALAERKCAQVGAAMPSITVVRTRVGRRVANPDVASRIRREADLVLDASGLGVDILTPAGTIAPAILCALIHLPSGALLGHTAVAGKPSTADLVDTILIARGTGDGSGVGRQLSLLVSSPIQQLPTSLLDQLSVAGIEYDPLGSERLRGGLALVASLGLRLGRIPLQPRRLGPRSSRRMPLATLGQLRSIIDRLVEERNASLETKPPSGLNNLLGPERARRLADLLDAGGPG